MSLIKWAISLISLFLILYLGTVWVWATLAAPELLSKISTGTLVAVLEPEYTAALVKIEDPTFYDHSGLDISNGQGLTTITSGVAKMVFLGNHQLTGIKGGLQSFYKGVFSCCKKIDLGRDVMALVLDRQTTKQDQLNIFLRHAYLGSTGGKGIVGFEDASVAYYGKKLTQLTENQFYGLIAMLIAPNHYHPVKNPKIHAERTRRVKAVVDGKCKPDGWRDLTYDHCAINSKRFVSG